MELLGKTLSLTEVENCGFRKVDWKRLGEFLSKRRINSVKIPRFSLMIPFYQGKLLLVLTAAVML